MYISLHVRMNACPPWHACLQRLPWRHVLRQLRRSHRDCRDRKSAAAVQSYYELEAEEYKRKVSLVGYFASCAGTAVQYSMDSAEPVHFIDQALTWLMCHHLQGVELTPELWLVKLLCGAIDPSYDEQDE